MTSQKKVIRSTEKVESVAEISRKDSLRKDSLRKDSLRKDSLKDNEPPNWQDVQEKVNQLYTVLERINLTEYITYLNNPRRLLLLNFGVGLVKGLGGAIGATLLLGIIVMFLKRLVLLNLPVIGGVIGEIVKMVNLHNGY